MTEAEIGKKMLALARSEGHVAKLPLNANAHVYEGREARMNRVRSMLDKGMTTKQIAQAEGVAICTMQRYVKAIRDGVSLW